MPTIFWLMLAFVMLVGELICPIFFMFWFAVGAMAALVLSIFIDNYIAEIIVFLVVSVIACIFIKPFTSKLFKNKTKDELNINGVVGKEALVTAEVSNQGGRVKVNSEDWTAITENIDDVISVGERVIVKRIDGVKLIVSKKENIEKE